MGVLAAVLAGTAAAFADAAQLSLLFRNLDDANRLAVYYTPHLERDKLQFVLDPEGNSDDDRCRSSLRLILI